MYQYIYENNCYQFSIDIIINYPVSHSLKTETQYRVTIYILVYVTLIWKSKEMLTYPKEPLIINNKTQSLLKKKIAYLGLNSCMKVGKVHQVHLKQVEKSLG